MKAFKNGLFTGLFLQLALGPVFFFIINLTLQKTFWDGLVAVFAVTMVDYFYITLAILGIGKSLEKERFKKIFGIISSIILVIFGIFIIKNILVENTSTNIAINSKNLFSSFTSVFFLTISNPMTIIFFTGLFASKAVEYNYTKKNLAIFGLATGFATFLFMSVSIILFYLLKENIPIILIQILNFIVGFVLIGYGGIRLQKTLKIKL